MMEKNVMVVMDVLNVNVKKIGSLNIKKIVPKFDLFICI